MNLIQEKESSMREKSEIPDFRQDVTTFPEFQQSFLLQKNQNFNETISFHENNETDNHSKSLNTHQNGSITLKEVIKPPKNKKSCHEDKKYVLKLQKKQKSIPKTIITDLISKDLTITHEIDFSQGNNFGGFLKNFRYRETKITKILDSICKIPMIQPFGKFKMVWDLFLFLNTIFLFFYIPMNLAFENFMMSSDKFLRFFQFGIYIFDVLINVNILIDNHGVLIRNRGKVLKYYLKHLLFSDALALTSLIFDSDSSVAFLKLLFFSKMHRIRRKFRELQEYFAGGFRSQSKTINNLFF